MKGTEAALGIPVPRVEGRYRDPHARSFSGNAYAPDGSVFVDDDATVRRRIEDRPVVIAGKHSAQGSWISWM